MSPRKPNRFHGRVSQNDGRLCDVDHCTKAGEFKAPRSTTPDNDGYHWFCLEHVRDYNQNWNFFDKATPKQAKNLNNGYGGWDGPTWPFGLGPKVSEDIGFKDIHGIFTDQPKFQHFDEAVHPITKNPLTTKDIKAFKTLGLEGDIQVEDIRKRYRELLKRYHPDRTNGDRSKEAKLRNVIEAYKHLMKAPMASGLNGAPKKSRN